MAERFVLYGLPAPRFFSQQGGTGGHVAHAYGVLDGLRECGFAVRALCEAHPGLTERVRTLHAVDGGARGGLRRQLWNARFARAARALLAERPQFAYLRYSVGFAPWLPLLRRAGSAPLVLEVNSFGAQDDARLAALERWALGSADLIVTISERVRELLAERLGARLAERCLVLPNAVDAARLDIAPRPAANGHVRAGYVGTLKPDYGLEDLLSAMRELPREQLELVVIGDGPLRARIQAQSESLPNVRCHGPAPFAAVPELLSELDILVCTTSERMSFQSPIKLYEYMAAGRAVIAPDTAQVRELLEDGQLGRLYRVGDAQSLAAALRELSTSTTLREQLGARARQCVREQHTWTMRVRRLLEELSTRGLI